MPSTPAELPVAPGDSSRIPTVGGAYFALMTLFSMNLLNYVDRYVFNAVGRQIQDELKINNFRWGILAGAFMVVYTIASPIVGYVGDRYSRRILLGFGVGLWSIATVGTAFSTDYWHMFFWRAILGIGEASYGIVAPTLLADLFPPKQRGRVMGFFYLALPLGGALGYGIGGVMGAWQGWRAAFWVVGLPGLVAAFAGLLIKDPGRGASEGKTVTKADRPGFAEYVALFKNRTFLLNTAGLAAVTFTTGALAVFGATFFQLVRGMTSKSANLSIGILSAVGGILGIALGIWACDQLAKRTNRSYLLWACFAVFVSVPFGLGAVLIPDRIASFTCLFLAMLMLSSVLGPCNTVTANVVPAAQRAAGYATSIFLLHLFGDISSPMVIGLIADILGKPVWAQSSIGNFLASLGAVPIVTSTGPTNLTAGLLAMAPTLLMGGLLFWLGSKSLPADTDRARAAGGADDADAIMMH